jgi:hypothetical protein
MFYPQCADKPHSDSFDFRPPGYVYADKNFCGNTNADFNAGSGCSFRNMHLKPDNYNYLNANPGIHRFAFEFSDRHPDCPAGFIYDDHDCDVYTGFQRHADTHVNCDVDVHFNPDSGADKYFNVADKVCQQTDKFLQ